MDIWENASLTEKGADLHNRLINGKTLKITKVKTGAGKVPVMYLRQQTEVTNPMQQLTLQPATISDDNIIIPVLLENIGLTESYELWQVGFYAEDPDEGEILYCIAQAAKGKDIPTEHESPGYSIVWNFHFKNSEENPFELNITPAGLVSMETLKKHTSDVNIHVTQEEKNAFYDKYTRSEVDNKFAALETNIDWKEAVDTYTDIMEMYPKPQDGWTVNVKDTDYTYRYNGTDWIAISSNAIPKATPALDGLMSKEQAVSLNKLEQAVGSLQNLTTSEKQNLVGAVNEVKSEVVQLNSAFKNYQFLGRIENYSTSEKEYNNIDWNSYVFLIVAWGSYGNIHQTIFYPSDYLTQTSSTQRLIIGGDEVQIYKKDLTSLYVRATKTNVNNKVTIWGYIHK